MVYAPYVNHNDDRLAQLCQAQIFFALLSSIALKYDAATLSNSTNMDYLLTTLTFAPLVLGFMMETPLFDVVTDADRRASMLEKVQPLRQLTSSMLSRTPSQKATTITARPLDATVSAQVESAVGAGDLTIDMESAAGEGAPE